MKKLQIILFILVYFAFAISWAQKGLKTLPYSFTHQVEKEIPVANVLHESNKDLLLMEKKDVRYDGFQFGKEISVNYNTINSGLWEDLPNGDRLWRLAIHSDSAFSLNLQFEYFYLPPNGKMHIYTADEGYVLGAFTEADNQPSRKFATSLLPGSDIVLEYYEPKTERYQAAIHLSAVVHGYKDFYFTNGKYGTSGSCNIDINCDEGAPYQDVKHAVCLILYGSRVLCSGTLVNNTSKDRTPYLLTAYHCLNGKDISNFVFIFNHEAISCGSGLYTDGFSINGAEIVDLGFYSDYALLKLSSSLPLYYHVYYAGWNNLDSTGSEHFCIHHPSGDVKKISLCHQSLEHGNSQGDSGTTHWKVPYWNRGTTETGSSGSALFNAQKQIIGQLDGGTASCSDTSGFDSFGKISYSWRLSENNGYGLQQWLDPLQTGATKCEGLDSYATNCKSDAVLYEIISPLEDNCQIQLPFRLCWYNNGSDSIENPLFEYQLDNADPQQFVRKGVWGFMEADTFNMESLTLSEGSHHFKIWIKVSGDENSTNDTLEIDFQYQKGASLNWVVKTDFYPSQTSWVLKDESGAILAENPSSLTVRSLYSDTFCLKEGCYDFVIYDSAGDGLYGRDGYGQGYYYLYLQDKAIASGVQFGEKDSIRFCVDSTLSVTPHFNEALPGFRLYPNPCSDFVHIELENSTSTLFDVNIFSMEGRLVKQLFKVNGIIRVVDLKPGMYVLQMRTDRLVQTKKLIINKP